MSILIKGMEMPDHCSNCPFMISRDDDDCILQSEEANSNFENCPLVEIKTSHGDLIDRNSLKKDFRMGNDCNNCETDWKSCQYDRVYSKMDFCEWIDGATVVIEAEGEE